MHEACPCKPCQKRKTAQGKASWPAGHLRASASPGPPLHKQLRKTAGQSCRTSTNGQFFARSSPLQAVSQEKDSAGQSFVARGPPACFAQPRAASAKLAPIQAAYMSSCASARTSCVARGRKRLRRAKLRGPRGHLYASASPGPPQLSSPLYKQLRKTAGQSCRTSTNGRFLARSSPLQAVSEEKDSAGQSFVARGPPACLGQPGPPQLSSPLYKQLRKTAGQSCRTSTNGQFFARSLPLQAVSEEKDSAGQSFVARGPACFAQPRAASAKLAPTQAASQDSRAKLSHKH